MQATTQNKRAVKYPFIRLAGWLFLLLISLLLTWLLFDPFESQFKIGIIETQEEFPTSQRGILGLFALTVGASLFGLIISCQDALKHCEPKFLAMATSVVATTAKFTILLFFTWLLAVLVIYDGYQYGRRVEFGEECTKTREPAASNTPCVPVEHSLTTLGYYGDIQPGITMSKQAVCANPNSQSTRVELDEDFALMNRGFRPPVFIQGSDQRRERYQITIQRRYLEQMLPTRTTDEQVCTLWVQASYLAPVPQDLPMPALTCDAACQAVQPFVLPN